ncbi:hypothetical protein LCGC14_2936760 [marine sediment metagenome]|uniref:Uncharacterized protein n=1 Tax=marine sediment metagenome TaxID=412755 RepID=A0A0F8Y6B8_9ZZZZ
MEDMTSLVANLCNIYLERIKDLDKQVAVWRGTSDFWRARFMAEKALRERVEEAFSETCNDPWFHLD